MLDMITIQEVRNKLREKCCGEVDQDGICMAPACRLGECLKWFDHVFNNEEFTEQA